MKTIRAGVIGLGRIAQIAHLPNLLSHPAFALEAVCDVSLAVSSEIASKYKVPYSYTDHRELLACSHIDAVFIFTQYHDQILEDALQTGLPIFIEKPISWSAEKARDLRQKIISYTSPVMVGYMKCFHPAAKIIRRHLQEAPPYLIKIHNLAGGLAPYHAQLPAIVKPGDVPLQQKQATEQTIIADIESNFPGGSVLKYSAYRFLLDLISHDLSVVVAELGFPAEIEYTRLWFAKGSPAEGSWSAKTASEYHLMALSSLVFRNGSRLLIEAGALFDNERPWDESITFYGEADLEIAYAFPFARNAPPRISLRWQTENHGTSHLLKPDYSDPFYLELQKFADTIHTGASLPDELSLATGIVELVRDIVKAA